MKNKLWLLLATYLWRFDGFKSALEKVLDNRLTARYNAQEQVWKLYEG